MSSSLVILVPVLGRPHRVAPLLDSIEGSTPEAQVLFLCDPDDAAEIAAIEEAQRLGRASSVRYDMRGGNYAHKVNLGVGLTTSDLLFLGADDLNFHPGWLEAALSKLTDGIGVVGTNDLGSPRVMAGQHSTHSLVTREYAVRGTIDEPDQLLHEGYPHEFVDDEFVATAKHRKAFAFAQDSHVEHLHPNWGKAPSDALYAEQRPRMKAGRKIFKTREHLWA